MSQAQKTEEGRYSSIPAIEVKLGKSRYCTHRPQIIVPVHPTLSFREVNAALYEVAAAVERATPDGEQWCVSIEDGVWVSKRNMNVAQSVVVSLELVDDTKAEGERAMNVLRKVAAEPRMMRIPVVHGRSSGKS